MSASDVCPRFQPGPWTFTGECNWDLHKDRSCQYCGSMNPDDLMKRLEAGDVEIVPTDKNYKIYVRNAGGAPFLQTFRDCPPDLPAHMPEACTHWVTRETSQGKFYFQHFSEEQRTRFIALHNERRLKIAHPGHFYVMPFFAARAPAATP